MLATLSREIADAVDRVAPAVVQVQGRRRPVSGLVYADDVVVTMTRALGRGDGVRVRRQDGADLEAELAGWDPATSLAVLKVKGLGVAPARVAADPARVGNIVVAVARSWSNAVTASAGIVAIIGGPLQTGRRHAIAEVIRTTAPMHDGFAGGALTDPKGEVIGMTTAAEIRGFGVVIPAQIVWKTAASVLEHGSAKRGYLGLAGQTVELAEGQRDPGGESQGLLVVAVTPGSPAASAGIMIGDLLIDFDNHRVTSSEDLLDLLGGERIGRAVPLRIRRGGAPIEVSVTVGERPSSRA
jgi:S1-C subfamily serine protease